MSKNFAELIRKYKGLSDLSFKKLGEQANVPGTTISNWANGFAKQPQDWRQVVKVARHSFSLTEAQTSELLQAAGHQSVTRLRESVQNGVDQALLSNWQKEEDSLIDFKAPFQAPGEVGPFIGRRQEIKRIREVLFTKSRICILRGIGGIGKTSLAIHMANRLRYAFPDGVLWADMGHVTEENDLVPILKSFALAYGRYDIKQYTTFANCKRVVCEVLATKKVLIVLENVHKYDNLWLAGNESSLLVTTHDNRILNQEPVTSIHLEAFPMKEAMELFTTIFAGEAAQEDEGMIKQLIDLVGGHPTAVKIMTSYLRNAAGMISAEEYCELLQDEQNRLSHLVRQVQDFDPNLDLRACFQVSYQALLPSEQKLFALLSLFPHSFSMEAVARVVDLPLIQVKQQMVRLKSLSLFNTVDPPQAQRYAHLPKEQQHRYELHVLLKLFAAEHRPSDTTAAAQRMMAYFGQLSEMGQENSSHYPLLELEQKNILWLLEKAAAQEQWAVLVASITGLTMINLGIAGFLDAYGLWAEAKRFLSLALDSPPIIENPPSLLQAGILLKMGIFAMRQAKHEEAGERFQASWDLLATLPDREPVILYRAYVCAFLSQSLMAHGPEAAMVWVNRGLDCLRCIQSEATDQERGYLLIRHATILARHEGQQTAAQEKMQEGISLLPPYPTAARVSGLMNVGNLSYMAGDYAAAKTYWEKALSDARRIGDIRLMTDLQQNLAFLESHEGNLAQMRAYHDEAIASYRRIGDVAGECRLLSNMAHELHLLGRIEEAKQQLETAVRKAVRHQLPEAVFALSNRARLHLQSGRLDSAQTDLQQADQLNQQFQLSRWQGAILVGKAMLTYQQGRYPEALALIDQALHEEIDGEEMGIAWRVKGQILQSLNQLSETEAAYRKSLTFLNDGDRFELARTCKVLGNFYLNQGDKTNARKQLETALTILTQLDLTEEVDAVKLLLNA